MSVSHSVSNSILDLLFVLVCCLIGLLVVIWFDYFCLSDLLFVALLLVVL
jgi:hypothetical protein